MNRKNGEQRNRALSETKSLDDQALDYLKRNDGKAVPALLDALRQEHAMNDETSKGELDKLFGILSRLRLVEMVTTEEGVTCRITDAGRQFLKERQASHGTLRHLRLVALPPSTWCNHAWGPSWNVLLSNSLDDCNLCSRLLGTTLSYMRGDRHWREAV